MEPAIIPGTAYDHDRFPTHEYDYVYLGKGEHYHEACRKVRQRGAIGGLMEIQFASGESRIVPRSQVKNISSR